MFRVKAVPSHETLDIKCPVNIELNVSQSYHAPLVLGAFGMVTWACARDARSDPGLAWGRAVGTNSSKDRLILAAC